MQTHESRRPTANIRDATEQNKSTSSVRAALYTHLLGDCDSKIAAIVNDLNDSGAYNQTDMTANVIKLKKFTEISSTLQQKTIGMYQNSVDGVKKEGQRLAKQQYNILKRSTQFGENNNDLAIVSNFITDDMQVIAKDLIGKFSRVCCQTLEMTIIS